MIWRYCALFCILAVAFCEAGRNDTRKHCEGKCRQYTPHPRAEEVMRLKELLHAECVHKHQCPTPKAAIRNQPCENGRSGEYECSNVDLLAFVPLDSMGSSGDGNDIWGWTDPESGREYAVVGAVDLTAFVDVTEPTEPRVIGTLRTHTTSSLWRDIKVFNNHAFIVSEASNHGMQVFDLTQLRDVAPGEPAREFTETAHYPEFGNCHNVVGNEDTGFMYCVGSRTCSGGLHMVDVSNPNDPQYAGCFSQDGYVHDAQCVVYKGPDQRYAGKEICFCYDEDTLTIVDVQDKSNPILLSRVPYSNNYYTHQGWLTEDHTHLLLDDELDELYGSNKNTRTLIWNVRDLQEPALINSFYSEKTASDHNLYIKGKYAYQSNYCAGLRILDVSGIDEGELKEVGYFDLAPYCSSPGFQGAWSSYPYFNSGTIVVNSIELGLFVLRFNEP
ncbi:uncharacterized protein [Oscarella lobularis]|uniref:uncharacterized protein n=1 Tax=Oscarella lobularis TaxID=121494 RepID=UPI003313CD0E